MLENRVTFLLNDLVKEMNSMADAMLRANFELTYSQFLFLTRINEAHEIDITRLAEALGVTKGAVSKRMGWFVERKLVETHQAADDAKRLNIRLTPKGYELAEAAGEFLEDKFLSTISKSKDFDEAVLRAELQKMRALMHEKLSAQPYSAPKPKPKLRQQ